MRIIEQIKDELYNISSICDGARKRDGSGFNKFDSRTFESLTYCDNWKDAELLKACKLFLKYQGQIGADPDLLSEVKALMKTLEKNSKVIKIETVKDCNYAYFYFPFDMKIKEAIKEIPNRKFDNFSKTWSIDFKCKSIYDKILTFADKYNFIVDGEPEITETEDQTIETQPEQNGKMEVIKDKLFISFKFISSQFNKDLLQDFKCINVYKKFNGETKKWHIFLDDINKDIKVKLLDLATSYNLEIVGEIPENRPEEEEKTLFTDYTEELKQKYPILKSYQVEGVNHILNRNKCLLGDTMGLGKTIQALTVLHHSKKLPALIIVPNSLKYNWQEEIKKFFPDLSNQVINSTSKIEAGKDIYIINYDIVSKFKETIQKMNFKYLILDESHYIKNSDTLRYKTIKDFTAENILLMSGTIITNRPKEILPQLKILNINFWGRKDLYFYQTYCNAQQTFYGLDVNGSSNTKLLYTNLTKHGYLRREKEQVLKDLPEKQISVVNLEIDNKSKYDLCLEDLKSFLSNMKGKNDQEILRSMRAEAIVKLGNLRQISAQGKIKNCIEFINNFFENNPNEKLVLFAHHKEIISILQNELKDFFPLTIDGSTEAETRQENIKAFQENDINKIMICSIKAASTGITLTRASNLFFIEIGYNPADLKQCEDRIHRIGQQNAVNIYYLLAKNTVESNKLMPLLQSKQELFNQIARGIFDGETESYNIIDQLFDSL